MEYLDKVKEYESVIARTLRANKVSKNTTIKIMELVREIVELRRAHQLSLRDDIESQTLVPPMRY